MHNRKVVRRRSNLRNVGGARDWRRRDVAAGRSPELKKIVRGGRRKKVAKNGLHVPGGADETRQKATKNRAGKPPVYQVFTVDGDPPIIDRNVGRKEVQVNVAYLQ